MNGIPKKESRDIASRNDSICAGTINWRSKPLRRYRTIVQLIAATTTDTGLKVRAELDENKYPKGVKVSDLQMAAVNLTRHSFHGDWNYTVSPQRKTPRRTRID